MLPLAEAEPMDDDCARMHRRLHGADEPRTTRSLIQAMSPALHWMPVGLLATRAVCAALASRGIAKRLTVWGRRVPGTVRPALHRRADRTTGRPIRG